jgi:hypothetical protein
LAVASDGSRLREKTVALAVELTAIATKDGPAGQEDLQELAECAFLPYLTWATETWQVAWRYFLVFACLIETVWLET